ncbi:MAG: methyltransferase domain-containing protein [Eubacteriales bacterium]
MGKMYQWHPEMIRFMNDSAHYTRAYEKMAEAIAPYLLAGGTVCDAGCGLGHLGLALSHKGFAVTAVDISDRATAGLKNTKYFTVENRDIFSALPEKSYDSMVFCMFGSGDEILEIAQKQCRGTVVVLRRHRRESRFSLESHKAGCHSFLNLAEELDSRGIQYDQFSLSLEMGQPLKSDEDAVKFFQTYSRDDHPESITFSKISHRLQPESSGKFKWYLPVENQFGVLIFHI